MSKSVLIWDFDGVMADSTAFVFSFWQQEMKRFRHDFTLQDYQATFTHKFPFEYLSENYPEAAPSIRTKYTQHEEQYYANLVPPFPEFIDRFKALGSTFEHHVVSSNLKSVIEKWLELYELKSYFKSIVGRETEGYKDQKINDLIAHHGYVKENVVFIGDTISDVEHAHAAQVQSVAVSWGVHPRRQLETVQPSIIYDSMESLFKRLKEEQTSSL